MKRIICTVTNDLVFDQRMIRICGSLAKAGYQVTLVGRLLPGSPPLRQQPFLQKRLGCWFQKGPLFYAEYNLRLFWWLLWQKAHLLCAIDLDTILPVLIVSRLKGTQRVYDAHELFCEMKEIVSRPSRYRLWKWIERMTVPHFPHCYTVCQPIADELQQLYGVPCAVIRNLPLLPAAAQQPAPAAAPFFIYQGAVNEGRSFETLVPAMKQAPLPLHIFGDGNFIMQTRLLIQQHGLEQQVVLAGKKDPQELRRITPTAFAGITLFENNGRSNYLSLANRFFDYIAAGIPQICIDFPSYRQINDAWQVALLVPDSEPQTLAAAMNLLYSDTVLYETLKQNCIAAAKTLNWQQEERTLIAFYQKILG